MNLISKLLLNSLYGKFGASFYNDILKILDISTRQNIQIAAEYFHKLEGSVKQAHIIDDKMVLVVIDSQVQFLDENKDNDMPYTNTNVAIASAITSLARALCQSSKRIHSGNYFIVTQTLL